MPLRISIIVPWRGRDDVEAHLVEHLKRLAETSPHLLEDLGFQRDKIVNSPVRTIYRRGKIAVAFTHKLPKVHLWRGASLAIRGREDSIKGKVRPKSGCHNSAVVWPKSLA